MIRYLILALTLVASLSVATGSFATGENGSHPGTGEHNGATSTNCGEDAAAVGDEC
jgi:hypothetical protein